jgi:hypothetical protein
MERGEKSVDNVVLLTSPGLHTLNSGIWGFCGLGTCGFDSGLTRVKARVHSILLESMKINVKRQNKETLSYSRHPARLSLPCPARTPVFRAGHFHIAGAILGIIQRITRRKLLQRHRRSFHTLKYRIQMAHQSPLCDGRGN